MDGNEIYHSDAHWRCFVKWTIGGRLGRIDGVSREGGVDTTNGRIDHLELYKMGSLGDVQ